MRRTCKKSSGFGKVTDKHDEIVEHFINRRWEFPRKTKKEVTTGAKR